MKIKISPSILAADFGILKSEINRVESAGADMIHIDVMDGHFVPNITMGPVIVSALRRLTKLPLESHLMITDPEKFADDFIKAGSDIITVHIEAIGQEKIKALSEKLKSKNVRLGVSLNPDTAIDKIKSVLQFTDMVLVMSVFPGFSGQKFIPTVIPKIKELRSIYDGDIAVDGGVNDTNAAELIIAGANILCSASYIFASSNPKEAIERMRNAGK